MLRDFWLHFENAKVGGHNKKIRVLMGQKVLYF